MTTCCCNVLLSVCLLLTMMAVSCVVCVAGDNQGKFFSGVVLAPITRDSPVPVYVVFRSLSLALHCRSLLADQTLCVGIWLRRSFLVLDASGK